MPQISMDRSGEMEVFVRIVREGGLSAAARSLELTPSAVSKLLARLETRLGSRLMTRTTRALALTAEGQAYFQAAEKVLDELENAERLVGEGAVRGRLAVNASLPFGARFVAPAIPAFLSRYPELTVDLSFTDDLVNIIAQQADVAIRMGNLPDSSLLARKLGHSRRVVCAAPDYLARHRSPQSPEDLQNHNCLTFNFRRSKIGWPFRIKRQKVDIVVGGNVQVNNGETMKQLVLGGVGVARLGHWHVAEEITEGKLVPLLEEFNAGDLETVSAIHVGGGRVPPSVRAFIDYMVETVATSGSFS